MSGKLVEIGGYYGEFVGTDGRPIGHPWSPDLANLFAEELNKADLTSQSRFVTLHQHTEREFSATDRRTYREKIAYLNFFGHPNGVFVEIRYVRPDGLDKPYRPIGYFPMKAGPREFISRIWVGQHYRRIPVESFVSSKDAIEILRHFCATKGERWPGVPWEFEDTSNWKLRISPEDDYYNPNEPPSRPIAQRPPSPEDVLKELGLPNG